MGPWISRHFLCFCNITSFQSAGQFHYLSFQFTYSACLSPGASTADLALMWVVILASRSLASFHQVAISKSPKSIFWSIKCLMVSHIWGSIPKKSLSLNIQFSSSGENLLGNLVLSHHISKWHRPGLSLYLTV